MIRFEVLNEVTARQDGWSARLSTQQRHLLAALVLAGGAVVTRQHLEEILWDLRAPYPEKRITQVAHEVRTVLQEATPGTDLVLSSRGGYRLLMAPEQADALSFRSAANEARRTGGPDGARLMRQALHEWGPDAAGLHGGSPLAGLPGQWADGTRHLLRTQYRDAVIHCLAYAASCEDYGPVLAECEQLAVDSVSALLDEEFVSIWVIAAAQVQGRTRALTIHQRAQEAAENAGVRFSPVLLQLGSRLRQGRIATVSAEDEDTYSESTAGPTTTPPSTTERPARDQPGNVFNAEVYLNLAGLSSDAARSVQAQVNVANESGAAVFGVQGGNVYYYAEGPSNSLPAQGERTENDLRGRSA